MADTTNIGPIDPILAPQNPVPKKSKAKIAIVAVIAVALVGTGTYLFAGGGLFQGFIGQGAEELTDCVVGMPDNVAVNSQYPLTIREACKVQFSSDETKAKFVYARLTPTIGGSTVTLNAKSNVDDPEYSWYIASDQIGEGQSFTYDFEESGPKNVILKTVGKVAGNPIEVITTEAFTIAEPEPEAEPEPAPAEPDIHASFSIASEEASASGVTAYLTDSSTGNISSWILDCKNTGEEIPEEQSAIDADSDVHKYDSSESLSCHYMYSADGSTQDFIPAMKVIDEDGNSDTFTLESSISIESPEDIVALISCDTKQGEAPLDISCTNEGSTGEYNSSNWTIAGPNITTVFQNETNEISYTFEQAGTYELALYLSGNNFGLSGQKTEIITVTAAADEAAEQAAADAAAQQAAADAAAEQAAADEAAQQAAADAAAQQAAADAAADEAAKQAAADEAAKQAAA
ncbi:MAG: hypothetical protein O3B47_01930, partial [bacterium]|nr:hypothetical protein [bacterium]